MQTYNATCQVAFAQKQVKFSKSFGEKINLNLK